MEENGLEPDGILFNILLKACYYKHRFSDAEKIWEMMEERNVLPDLSNYNLKLYAFVNGDRISKAVDWIEEMKREGVEPYLESYNILITGFCDSWNLNEAIRWVGVMKKNGCKPNWFTYVNIGGLACAIGDCDSAFKLYKEAMNEKVVISEHYVQLVVDGLVTKRRMKEANELLELGNFEQLPHPII